MKLQIIILLVFLTTSLFGQNETQKELDKALTSLKSSFEKRDFSILEPFLDKDYKVAEYKRPTADKVVPQLLAQGAKLVSFNVKKKEIKTDKIVVEIEYEVEGHLFGTDKSTSTCILTPSAKFLTIGYFEDLMAIAKKVKN